MYFHVHTFIRVALVTKLINPALFWLVIGLLCIFNAVSAQKVLIPMDNTSQKDHMRAYGIAYYVLKSGSEVDWLLNYRGGSFVFDQREDFVKRALLQNVSYEIIDFGKYNRIISEISAEGSNKDVVRLEKAPKIAVYTPQATQPWDDAVTLVLTYADIEYTKIYDNEVLGDKLKDFDWLHLHHEDFTGQYGKFWANYRHTDWYKEQVKELEEISKQWGYNKVSKLKLAVCQRIKEFVKNGGFLFAMCSATDTYDIALAAANTDINESMFDGDPRDPQCMSKLDFSQTFAFQNFTLETNPMEYEHSNIDVTRGRNVPQELDYFSLFEYSAKWDPVPTMLCQNHTTRIKGFMGQTTGFAKTLIKPDVLIMGENKANNEARYIHGNLGKGMWTFYGGHDPEDYQHHVGEEPTDLVLHKNSPGYRLILNNILFPAAKKKKQKT
jgi:hypothetical protein